MPAPRTPKKVIPPRFGLLIFQLAGLAGALWLWSSQWAPLKAADSPIQVVGAGVLYLLVCWICAFGMTLWTYIALSLDDFFDLVMAAVRASVHAMWFVPGMLLAVSPAPWWITLLGLLMMANGARLVVANPPPQRRALSRRKLRTSHRLFAESQVRGGLLTKESAPAILGAFALQAGTFAIWAGYPKWAGPLFAG